MLKTRYEITLNLSIDEIKSISKLLAIHKRLKGSWLFDRWTDAIISAPFNPIKPKDK